MIISLKAHRKLILMICNRKPSLFSTTLWFAEVLEDLCSFKENISPRFASNSNKESEN